MGEILIEMEEEKKTTEEEYCFLQEAVQEKDVKKGPLFLKKVINVIVLAVIFGAAASVVFWKVQDVLGERDARIYRENLLKNTSDPQKKQDRTAKESDAEKVAAYEEYWDSIAQIGEQCSRSVVSVGQVHTESWYQKSQKDDTVQSGLIFKRKGKNLYILTQATTVAEKKLLQVEFLDGTRASAKLVDEDRGTGIAVLCVDIRDVAQSTRKEIVKMDFTQYASDSAPNLSDRIILFGCPNGLMKSVMLGNIVNTELSVQTTNKNLSLYATDVAYTEGGNGFAADIEGRLAGVITAAYPEVTGETNWSFVSVADIAAAAQAIIDHRQTAYLGIQGKDAGDKKGVYVTAVALKSPAYHGGIRVADRICAVDGSEIKSMKDLQLCLSTHESGDRIEVRLERESGGQGMSKTLKIELR